MPQLTLRLSAQMEEMGLAVWEAFLVMLRIQSSLLVGCEIYKDL